ncbi:MAG: DUF5103 domain-containing protein [Bacteroidota bacterium]
MLKTKLTLFLLSCLVVTAMAQDDRIRYMDHTYNDNIKSIQFGLRGVALSQPIIGLNTNTRLQLEFDDLGEIERNYNYRVILCDADWTPSSISELEYVEGFNGERIREFDYSINTRVEYTHYSLTLPNNELQLRYSGNYLLLIYEDNDDQTPILSRRFMVVEPLFNISSAVVRTIRADKIQTHHEIDFSVLHKNFVIDNPPLEVKVVILQNNDWGNAITGLAPLYDRAERLVYDFQDRIVFPAGKEFRFLDLRNLRFKNGWIKSIEQYNDGYEVVLNTDKKRDDKTHSTFNDINGKFVIENLDENASRRRVETQFIGNTDSIQTTTFFEYDPTNPINALRADYANVRFSLRSPFEIDDQDVYLFGAITDWQLKEEFKMEYNDLDRQYQCETVLKQGYYDYVYVTTPKGEMTHSVEEIEGNSHETENDYTILVYYRPFGARYDRLLAVQTFNSNE